MAQGDRHCKECGKYLGNYMNGGDYYGLLARKHCDECLPIVKNMQKNFSKKNLRKARKPLISAITESLILREKENELLREKNRILEAEIKSLYGG